MRNNSKFQTIATNNAPRLDKSYLVGSYTPLPRDMRQLFAAGRTFEVVSLPPHLKEFPAYVGCHVVGIAGRPGTSELLTVLPLTLCRFSLVTFNMDNLKLISK